MISYRTGVDGLTVEHMTGFFVGWPNPPSPATLLAALCGSTAVVTAHAADQVVGFANAMSDGTLAAFIPLLEVRPDFQHRGIGSELVRRVVGELDQLYSIDLVCDDQLAPFYERLGFTRIAGMAWRNRTARSGDVPAR